jgi:N-acetylglutamate synthase-like GNAT family acetyltransferase
VAIVRELSDHSGTRSPVETLAISVRRATPKDAVALSELVNDCYRVERFFVDGDRTNPAEIAEMTRGGVFLVLEDARGLAAAVYLERRGSAIYFGMLSVRADLQGVGLGTRLVRIAEAMGEAMGASEVTLKIVNLREELGRWYRSLGSREGATAPYVHRSVKQPCHFVEMYKAIGEGPTASPGGSDLAVGLGAA